MTSDSDVGSEFRNEVDALPLGMGTQSEALGCKGGQKRLDWKGHLLKREIKHKALLPQVQALYTRATYYLVSNYKAISHQT